MAERAEGTEAAPDGGADLKTPFRGSSLLLAGRFVAIGLNLLAHVALVRLLSENEYGSLSFALALMGLVANANLLGLGRAMSRFGPLYDTPEDRPRALGSLFVALGAITLGGLLLLALGHAFDGRWQPHVTSGALSAQLVTMLLVLVPLTAIDAVLEVVAAHFAGARAIFFRRHLMTPLLRLAIIGLVALMGWGVKALAICYVVAAIVGILAYAIILRASFVERGIRRPRRSELPVRSVLGYGSSMLLVDLAGVSILHLPAVVLEMERGSDAVAALRAVTPLATLVLIVVQTFRLLYVPLATRSFEEGGAARLSQVYWAGARWLALLTFPIFAICAFLPRELITLLIGDRYLNAAPLASIMALGYYLHAILGVNTLTLQALGKGAALRAVALAGISAAVAANLVLVPRYGALGAAISSTLTLFAHDAVNLVLAWRSGAIQRPERGFARPYLWVLAVSAALFGAVTLTAPSALVSIPAVVLAIGVVFAATRRELALGEWFPELRRIPVVGGWIG